MQRLLDRYPKELSGGQQQRVAMGRALVGNHNSSSLTSRSARSTPSCGSMPVRLQDLQQELGATTNYVTHDQVEAQALGAKIVVLDDGAVQQVGTPDEIFDMPANRIVAGLSGSPPMNFLDAELTTREYQVSVVREYDIAAAAGCGARRGAEGRDREVILGVRRKRFTWRHNRKRAVCRPRFMSSSRWATI